jgi:hypothetical protein
LRGGIGARGVPDVPPCDVVIRAKKQNTKSDKKKSIKTKEKAT